MAFGYLQNLLSSGLPVLVTRTISDFAAADGLQLLNWFSPP
jgi:hypothetical protein